MNLVNFLCVQSLFVYAVVVTIYSLFFYGPGVPTVIH